MLLSQLLSLLNNFFNGSNHVEGLLRQGVVLTSKDALEALDGFLEWHQLAQMASKNFSHLEGL